MLKNNTKFIILRYITAFLAVICLSIHLLYSQNATISGKILDKATGEALPYVNIFLPSINKGLQSNQYGFYSISLNKGDYKIKYSNTGYIEQLLEVTLKKDTIVNINLEIANNYLDEVKINTAKESSVNESSIGTINIPIARLKSVPAILGEVDILKALTLTPGVSSSSEGSAGLIVRGGTPDQNLILLDDVPVYNVSHLFGMVSIFNPDVFKKIDLYKGSFPARYGGRLSSVIDVVTKEGNSMKKNREFSIGLLSSKMLLEGPLFKQNSKTSYLVALRSTYFTPFLLPTLISFKQGNSEQYFNYWMYDSNIKINHQINQRQQLFLSFYQGHDYWTTQEGGSEIRNKFGLSWGNRTFTVRYNNILNQKLFLKTIGGYTKYNYQNTIGSFTKLDNDWSLTQSLNSVSSVRDYLVKVHFDYFPNINHQIKFGTDLVFHKFQPSYLKTTYYINPDTLSKINTPVYSSELSLFAEDEIRLNKYLKGNIGFRLVNYHVDRVNYHNIEPRFALNINLPNNFTLKGGYVKMNQNIQLLSSNTVGLPNDIWIPATTKIPPSNTQQVSFGLSKSFYNQYELSLEAYQKNYKNLIDYPTGTNFLNTFYQNWENIVELNGTGKVRGFELFLNKTQGKLTGWTSYTYMKNQRSFPEIDAGEWFYSNFDKRHSIATTINTKISKYWDFSSSWVFSTGNPTTLPIGLYPNVNREFTSQSILVYGKRNNYRMPNYHRLDLGFTKKWNPEKNKEKQLSIGFYNAYNQANPYYLDVQRRNQYDKNDNVIGYNNKLLKVGILPIMPYLTYSIKYLK